MSKVAVVGAYQEEDKVRYTCDVPVSIHNRAMRFIKDDRAKNYWGVQAIEERVTRLEGRDNRSWIENKAKLLAMLKELISDGEIDLAQLISKLS